MMRRRSFLTAMFGLAAAPVAVKAMEVQPPVAAPVTTAASAIPHVQVCGCAYARGGYGCTCHTHTLTTWSQGVPTHSHVILPACGMPSCTVC